MPADAMIDRLAVTDLDTFSAYPDIAGPSVTTHGGCMPCSMESGSRPWQEWVVPGSHRPLGGGPAAWSTLAAFSPW
jgi:hypothetical protein